MRYLIPFLIICIISYFSCTLNSNPNELALTTIDLDKEDKLIVIDTIDVKTIYDSDWFAKKPGFKEKFIPRIIDIIEGPDSTLYTFDIRNRRLVQITQNGYYIRSVGGPGSGPGEFIEPYGAIQRSQKYIYIPDNFGMRVQLFDLQGNYRRSINSLKISTGLFYVTPDDKIMISPPKHNLPQIPYMVILHDSLGIEINKIAAINYRYDFVINNNIRKSYSIVANEAGNQIWCVFTFVPIIWRFDFKGKLLEEIQFKSKEIDHILKMGKNSLTGQKRPPGVEGGVLLLNNPNLFGNDLIINISHYGNFQLSVVSKQTKLTKKFKLMGIPEEIVKRADPSMFMLKNINHTIFAFERLGIILKEKK